MVGVAYALTIICRGGNGCSWRSSGSGSSNFGCCCCCSCGSQAITVRDLSPVDSYYGGDYLCTYGRTTSAADFRPPYYGGLKCRDDFFVHRAAQSPLRNHAIAIGDIPHLGVVARNTSNISRKHPRNQVVAGIACVLSLPVDRPFSLVCVSTLGARKRVASEARSSLALPRTSSRSGGTKDLSDMSLAIVLWWGLCADLRVGGSFLGSCFDQLQAEPPENTSSLSRG